jgi:arylsulfatase A-like enzyme
MAWIVVLFVATVGLIVPAQRTGQATDLNRRPTIVLFLTDDQRWDTLWAMPHVRHLLGDHGVTFRNAFVVNSLCCPSRTSILTGDYSHTTGVYSNSGFHVFDDSSNIATWLDNAGYSTAFFGKYLNGYSGTTYVPPGWERWFAFADSGSANYYDYKVVDDGHIRAYGSGPRDYSTDVLARKAVSFIRQSPGPLFVFWAPRAPHTPAIPAERDKTRFSGMSPFRPPNYNEADVSDKPGWLQAQTRLRQDEKRHIDEVRKAQYQSLQAVDRGVGRIVEALRETGRLHRAMLVFMSDNGLAWGEHRWTNKLDPYEESIRVPLVIRYDPVTTRPRSDSHIALNIDLAPTWARLAQVTHPKTDGISLLPVLRQRQQGWRTNFLIEDGVLRPHNYVSRYCAVRSYGYLYVAYETGEEELYALRRDPFELRNRADSSGLRDVRRHLRRRLRELCDPPPPGLALQH